MFIYSVYDKKACVHTSPFFAVNNETAVRSFYRLANDNRTDVNMFPDDYALYRIGEFNSDHGSVAGFVPVEHLVDANSLIKLDKKSESK